MERERTAVFILHLSAPEWFGFDRCAHTYDCPIRHVASSEIHVHSAQYFYSRRKHLRQKTRLGGRRLDRFFLLSSVMNL